MRFAILGCAAFVAPRHLKAVIETGNELIAAMDPNDNVGVLDSFSRSCQFFTEHARFDRYLIKRAADGRGADFLSVCTPNYLHDSHIRYGLHNDMDVICEKPLVISPWNLDNLEDIERRTGKRVFTVMQLRHHPVIQALRDDILSQGDKIHKVQLNYVTGRGPWFAVSWKSQIDKAGGIATNIGIHFLDMLIWIFGKETLTEIYQRDQERVIGYSEFERARVSWSLSSAFEDLSDESLFSERRLVIDGKEIEFSDGFKDLHTVVYQEVLAGRGLGIAAARPSIELAYKIGQLPVIPGWDYDLPHGRWLLAAIKSEKEL